MSLEEWEMELTEANKEYDNGNISRTVYENKIQYIIYRLHKEGYKEPAKRIAKAHGYNVKTIISEWSKK